MTSSNSLMNNCANEIEKRSMKSRAFGRNRDYVAAHNRRLVLGVIQAHEPVSRREIADITNLTTSTISNIVNRLMHDGFVTEAGVGKSMGGGRVGHLDCCGLQGSLTLP